MTNVELAKLVEKAKAIRMSVGDREQQRRSFAYGNANIENAAVTKEMIDEVAERMAQQPNLKNIVRESEQDGSKQR